MQALQVGVATYRAHFPQHTRGEPLECLGFAWHGPLTLAQFVRTLPYGSPERAVWSEHLEETTLTR